MLEIFRNFKMKKAADLYALAAVVNAFPSLIVDGKTAAAWKYTRNGQGIIAMAPSPIVKRKQRLQMSTQPQNLQPGK